MLLVEGVEGLDFEFSFGLDALLLLLADALPQPSFVSNSPFDALIVALAFPPVDPGFPQPGGALAIPPDGAFDTGVALLVLTPEGFPHPGGGFETPTDDDVAALPLTEIEFDGVLVTAGNFVSVGGAYSWCALVSS